MSNLQRAKVVLGVQNFQKTVFNTSAGQVVYVADYYDDFSAYYSISSQAQVSLSKMYYTDYGQYYTVFERVDNSSRFVLSCNYLGILNKATNVTKEYSQQFDEKLSTYFDVFGVSSTVLNYTSNISSLQLDRLGVKTVLFTVSYFNYTTVVSQQVTVVDTTKPQMTFVGVQNVYVTNLQQFYSSYSDFSVTAIDEYDGELVIQQSDNLVDEIGEYQVIYTAIDQSGNVGVLTRNVYIGKCELSSNNDTINVNGNTPLPVQFTVFGLQDFDVLYKLQSETNYTTYTQDTGIVCKNLGMYEYNLKLTNKYNSSIVYNFNYSVICKDIQAPTIQILGEKEMSLFINERYIESGIQVTDNYIQGVFDLDSTEQGIEITVTYTFAGKDGEEIQVESIDTTKVGVYTITYKAVDIYENQSTNQRIVNVLYYSVKAISIDTEGLKSSYGLNQTVAFKINVGPKNVDPQTKIVWYVNDEVYATTFGFDLDILFDKEGNYTIYAVDTLTNVKTEKISIRIYDKSSTILIVVIASVAVVLVASFVIVLVVIKRKKKREV